MNEVADQVEVAERTEWCINLLIAGYSQRQIVDAAHAGTTWGQQLTKRMLRNYVHKAQTALAGEVRQIDRRAHLTVALARYEFLYRRSVENSDYRGACSVQDKIVDLLGLSSQTALAIDWRDSAEKLGVDPDELFETLLEQLGVENVTVGQG